MSWKNGCSLMRRKRSRRNFWFASPRTNAMCGVLLMNVDGSRIAPSVTREPQNVFVVRNWPLIAMAFEMLTLPSAASGV